MKIDRRDPRHWGYLVRSGLNMAAAAVLRPILPRHSTPSVVLYAHTFGGNLTALYDYAQATAPGEIDFAFASLDESYLARLDAEAPPELRTLSMLRLRDVISIARSHAIVTAHRSATLELLKRWTTLPFIDVWHGMPYKGFTRDDFAYLRGYTEVWVTSPDCADIYVNTFGVDRRIVRPSGYARVDRLVNRDYSASELKAKYGIEEGFDKIVLLAPTWKQDDANRSVIPFGESADDFFEALNEVGRKHNTLIIFRAHLHVAEADSFKSYPFVRNMSNKRFPLIEEFLFLADICVTDWSSLAFDYLVLERPTIFLDVPPPFKNGFSVPPEHRFGDIVATLSEFVASLHRYLDDPAEFTRLFAEYVDASERFVYGDFMDGRASERQLGRLRELMR